ncbi:hypothetical protein CCACVL1_26900 [Corchorus capsularis]|uniref:Uncharacterized protein n=1 Tax=Corchorus capsularis TaxID=210143 RepID=A0A1R3GCT1_COCAP|nr:hypothetical protein CCACVL1_26900 [Corchorus capsularis]
MVTSSLIIQRAREKSSGDRRLGKRTWADPPTDFASLR